MQSNNFKPATRDIKDFKGDCLLVGGGWCNQHQLCKPSWRQQDSFYTIDLDPKTLPDHIANITDPSQFSSHFNHRFKFIFFECVSLSYEKVIKAFNNVFKMLTDDGLLLYVGGSCFNGDSIPETLLKAGFNFSTFKNLDPNNPKTKHDKGSISLASKGKKLMDIHDIEYLPEVAKNYINYYKFFNPEPYSLHLDPKLIIPSWMTIYDSYSSHHKTNNEAIVFKPN